MHELGIVEEVLRQVTASSAGANVTRVILEVGTLTAVLPDALRFCFDLAAEDTVAQGAVLEIIEVPGQGRCRACQALVESRRPFAQCQCGGTDMDWIAGDELKIKAMEVA